MSIKQKYHITALLRSIILLILLTMSNASFGQSINTDSLIAIKKETLKGKIFCILERKCESMMVPLCGYSNYYILWQNKGQTFIQKINKCETENIKIDSTNYFINFYFNFKKQIQLEEVERFRTENGSFVFIDHYCMSIITIYENDKETKKEVNSFDLKEVCMGDKNKNYAYNNNLKIVELDRNSRKIFETLFK